MPLVRAADGTYVESGGGSGAPAGAAYVTEAAHADLSAEVLLSAAIEQAAYGSLTAAAIAGRLKFPTDGYSILRDDGSALDPYGPLWPLTSPGAVADWTWVNQASATATADRAGIYLTHPSGGTVGNHILVKNTPATPWTVTAGFLPLYARAAGATSGGVGLLFRQSSDGKLAQFFERNDTAGQTELFSTKYTSPTVFSATYTTIAIANPHGPLWLRIADDGTNRICSYSSDGRNFTAFHTVGRTDFLTADQYGFFVEQTAGAEIGALLLSLVVA